MEIPNPELRELYEIMSKKYEKKYVEDNWAIIAESFLLAKGKFTESIADKAKRTGYNIKDAEELNDKMIQDEIRKIRKHTINGKIPLEAAAPIMRGLDELEKVAFIKAV